MKFTQVFIALAMASEALTLAILRSLGDSNTAAVLAAEIKREAQTPPDILQFS